MKKLTKILYYMFIIIAINSCTNVKKSSSQRIDSESFYIVESIRDSIHLENGFGIIRGRVFDEHSKRHVVYGQILITDEYIEGALVDSLGNFQMLIKKGINKLKIRSASNHSLFIDTFLVKEKTIYTLKIYLGSNIIY